MDAEDMLAYTQFRSRPTVADFVDTGQYRIIEEHAHYMPCTIVGVCDVLVPRCGCAGIVKLEEWL